VVVVVLAVVVLAVVVEVVLAVVVEVVVPVLAVVVPVWAVVVPVWAVVVDVVEGTGAAVVVVTPPVLTRAVSLETTAWDGCRSAGVLCLAGAGRKAMVTSWSFSSRTPDSQSGLQVSSRPPVEPCLV
jgi:hypothetical protein